MKQSLQKTGHEKTHDDASKFINGIDRLPENNN